MRECMTRRMKMKKKLMILLGMITVIACIGLTACGSSDTAAEEPAAEPEAEETVEVESIDGLRHYLEKRGTKCILSFLIFASFLPTFFLKVPTFTKIVIRTWQIRIKKRCNLHRLHRFSFNYTTDRKISASAPQIPSAWSGSRGRRHPG